MEADRNTPLSKTHGEAGRQPQDLDIEVVEEAPDASQIAAARVTKWRSNSEN